MVAGGLPLLCGLKAHDECNDASGTIFIVTESVFSMDGDLCPMAELAVMAEKQNAHLIIDEAHATGIIGEKGEQHDRF